jgi:hypothetical protein
MTPEEFLAGAPIPSLEEEQTEEELADELLMLLQLDCLNGEIPEA